MLKLCNWPCVAALMQPAAACSSLAKPKLHTATTLQVFGFLVRLDNGGDKPGVEYVTQHPDVLSTLFRG